MLDNMQILWFSVWISCVCFDSIIEYFILRVLHPVHEHWSPSPRPPWTRSLHWV